MQRKNAEAIHYHIMMAPGIILLTIFSIIPLFGLIIIFENFIPAKGLFGSKWVGLDNIIYMFQIPDSKQVFLNTVIIAIAKIIAGIIVPVFFALVLNEIKNKTYKKTIQTIAYMPHFLSWVLLGNIFVSIFSLDGLMNQALPLLGIKPVMFMGSSTWFRPIIILTDTWKNFGYGAIIYLAALTAIDFNLYEAAEIDGATRLRQLFYITLPCLVPTIILMTTLSLGNIMNAGFEQILNMYNPLVYGVGDIIDTYVYRMGLVNMQYSLSATVGFLKSILSMFLISVSYILANKLAGYKIF